MPWFGTPYPRQLTDDHFFVAAEEIGCDIAAIKAVWEVEASGQHFLKDSSLVRRFEPHHFPREHWRRLGFNPGSKAPWRASLKIKTTDRDRMLTEAYRIDREAAVRAASWGAPQIMGFNHEAAGYDSALSMVREMTRGADRQLIAFVALVKDWGIDGAIRSHDWRAFARRYNGSGQVDHYARLIETAYRKHAGGQGSFRVLRAGARGESVRELQRALDIEDDGAFGPRTEAAVRAFQRDHGLAVDGIVGHMTWEALCTAEDVARAPEPETQNVRLDDMLDRFKTIGAIFAPVTAAVTAISQALPDNATTLLVGGAVVGALMVLGTWIVLYLRKSL